MDGKPLSKSSRKRRRSSISPSPHPSPVEPHYTTKQRSSLTHLRRKPKKNKTLRIKDPPQPIITTIIRSSQYTQNHAYGNTDKYPGIRPFLEEYTNNVWNDDDRIPLLPPYLFFGSQPTTTTTVTSSSSSSSTTTSSLVTGSNGATTNCQVLDIGCGYGYFSILLMERYGIPLSSLVSRSEQKKNSSSPNEILSPPVVPFIRSITGIDISDTTIKRARTLLAHRQQAYLSNASVSPTTINNNSTLTTYLRSLPLSLRQIQKTTVRTALYHHRTNINFSSSSLPSTDRQQTEEFIAPWYSRIHFRTENFIADDTYSYTAETYDVVLCLQVTKWIQLYNGDVGILLLFRKIYHILKSSGYLVLLIDPWESYAKDARSISKEVYDIYANLRMKPDQFEPYLVNKVHFKLIERIPLTHRSTKEGSSTEKSHTLSSSLPSILIFQK